jgi:hypothetical protein
MVIACGISNSSRTRCVILQVFISVLQKRCIEVLLLIFSDKRDLANSNAMGL